MRPHQIGALVFVLIVVLALLAMLGDAAEPDPESAPAAMQVDGIE